MTTVTRASQEWMSRPADERYTSLIDMRRHFDAVRRFSSEKVVANRALTVQPADDDPVRGLEVVGQNGTPATMSHWSFGQLASLAGAPAGYLRTLPAPIAADAINYGLRFHRGVEDVGVLVGRKVTVGDDGLPLVKAADTLPELRAATGPRYGRIWNAEVSSALVDRFGDGVTGQWKVPGEFGRPVEVNKANTTLYASDRDMFVFLADESRTFEVRGRRNGETGAMSRGFYIWNSEVGSASCGIAFFLFDYVCCNRIIWGVSEFNEVRIRHTSGAPDRWLEEITPVLTAYSEASAAPIIEQIEAAKQRRFDDDLGAFLANRFGSKKQAELIQAAHLADEGRPIETLWDVVTGATALARTVEHQDARVDLERQAGKVFALAA